jgi:UDP-glucose 4-epimerase
MSNSPVPSGRWLVTGGAGYIGAHVARCLLEAGRAVTVLDDLSIGRPEFVSPDAQFVQGSVDDPQAVDRALRAADGTAVDGVVHLAGFKYAGVSVDRPLHTYRQNVTGTAVLLERMIENGVHAIVFSSSAGVYGTPDVELVTEQTPVAPESPYGESKLIGEWLIKDVARVTPLRHTSLRYFNVVGSGYPDVYDLSPHNLFPLVLKDLTSGRTPHVRGHDYPTRDGSCLRDYVHVQDVALAHVAAVAILERGGSLEPVYNLGSGQGVTVLEIMHAVAAVTGIEFQPELRERRPGDPAKVVASGELAARDLDWAPRHDLKDMVESAWQAWTRHSTAATPDR